MILLSCSTSFGLTNFGSLESTNFGRIESTSFGELQTADYSLFDEKPRDVEIYIYTEEWCPACTVAKNRIKRDAPWIKLIPKSGNQIPSWVTSLPTFHWNNRDGSGQSISGWDDSKFNLLVRSLEQLREPELYANLPSEAQPTPHSEVRRILEVLSPKQNEVFVDFGCGYDARFCIAASSIYGCKSIGIEIDPARAESARMRVRSLGLEHLVQIIEGDATTVDVNADVGVAYLWPDVLEQMKPKLENLDRFASVHHEVPGLSMKKNGDSFVWSKPQPAQHQNHYQPKRTSGNVAYYNGVAYTSRVCNSSSCRMCAAIEAGLRRK